MPSVHDRFKLVSDFEVRGDQVHAVPELVEGLNRGDSHQVLLGVTGSGKTECFLVPILDRLAREQAKVGRLTGVRALFLYLKSLPPAPKG